MTHCLHMSLFPKKPCLNNSDVLSRTSLTGLVSRVMSQACLSVRSILFQSHILLRV